jgi:hypothetical protein
LVAEGNVLQDLKTKIQGGQISLNDAIMKAMPSFRGKVSDERLIWLSNELQGYPNALDFYSRPSQEFVPYRVVAGRLKMMDKTGNVSDLTNHPIAKRNEFFLSAPVAWLEESMLFPGQITYVEMQELNVYLKGQGAAVCELTKDQLTRILNSLRQSLCAVIDEVTAKAK